MAHQLTLVVCSNYEAEVKEVVRSEHWTDVAVSTFTRMCIHPKIIGQVNTDQVSDLANREDVIVLNCHYLQPHLEFQNFEQINQCFDLLINNTFIMHALALRQFVIAPNWLKDWQIHVNEISRDPENVRRIIKNTADGLLLLDTGLNPKNRELLDELGAYLNLPVQIQPVGLDFLRLYIKQIVYAWHQKLSLDKIELMNREANKIVADYSMTIDLLTHLTQIHDEDVIHDEIADLFSMLFARGSVIYFPYKNRHLRGIVRHDIPPEEKDSIEKWLNNSIEPFRYSSSGKGFQLRIGYLKETLGVLVVDNLSLPQHIDQYLNLALMISGLCGLSIYNSLTYQKLQRAEKHANQQRKIADTLRLSMTEISKDLGHEGLLEQILMSLYQVIPYNDALVFLKEGDSLIFRYGMRCEKEKGLTSYVPVEKYLKIPINWPTDHTLTQRDVTRYPVLKPYINPDSAHSWIGLHLVHHDKIIGLLSISSKLANQYNESSVRLVEAFGSEVSIIIENDRLLQEFRDASIHDSLTGLYNRRQFFKVGLIEFERAKRYHHPLSAIMMDIDFFKRVNDTYGHLTGDQVLSWFARTCMENKRTSDIVCRYGGEEFAFLLPETSLENATHVAERLRQEVSRQTIPTSKGDISITCSIGVATSSDGLANLEQLLDHSDEALYSAKNSGRNRVNIWEQPA